MTTTQHTLIDGLDGALARRAIAFVNDVWVEDGLAGLAALALLIDDTITEVRSRHSYLAAQDTHDDKGH